MVRVNANNLVSKGTYNLGLECRQPISAVDDSLTCGGLLSGAIDAAGEVDLITFTGQSGDVVDLTLVRTGGFDSFYGRVPRATVFTPTGAVLAAFNANSQKELTLPESGTYVVRVNANTLVHTGTYDLELECL